MTVMLTANLISMMPSRLMQSFKLNKLNVMLRNKLNVLLRNKAT